MMQIAVLVLCLVRVNGISPEATTASMDSEMNQTLDARLAHGQATLNDMFREVEKLMEDTQHKLEDAVYQMDNESAKSMLFAHDLPSNYADESSTETKVGNKSVRTAEPIDKVTDSARILVPPRSGGNEIDRECIVDEDCENGSYCLYEVLYSRCLPCKALDTPCTKDEECCVGQLCLWGQCSENVTKGEAGSICQHQSDCNTHLCCAFHKALLFPVCTAKPMERERCLSPSNHLMELLSWDKDGEGPREHCPCSGDLQCQPLGRGSLCLSRQNSSSEELPDELYSEMDYVV